MTKQEEIRKGMETILKAKEMQKITRDAILGQLLGYLHSRGVVIKHIECEGAFGAGYVVVESLIEEE